MSFMVEQAQSFAPDGWTVSDSSTLVCPCGHVIEWDGECPNGHISFLRQYGFI